MTSSDTESIDHAKVKAIQESLTKLPPTEPVVDVSLMQGNNGVNYAIIQSCWKFTLCISYFKLILGTRSLINDCNPDLMKDFQPEMESVPTLSCRKDLGEIPGKLRHYSRGHVFIVRPCGHIEFWKSIFK